MYLLDNFSNLLINQSINVLFHQRYKSSNKLQKRIPKQLKFDLTRNKDWKIFKTNPSGQCLGTKMSLVTV